MDEGEGRGQGLPRGGEAVLGSRMRVSIVPLLVAALAGAPALAAPKPDSRPSRLPAVDQVAAYVRDNWADYARRIDVPADTPPPALETVQDVACRNTTGTPECAITVSVRLADGSVRDETLTSSFEWAEDGQIEEVVVLRPRRRTS
jgi:hypothetical protein